MRGPLMMMRGTPASAVPVLHQVSVNPGDAVPVLFESQSIGPASPNRTVIVVVMVRASALRTIDAVRIGGEMAALDAATSAAYNPVAIASLRVPEGTTADIEVSFPNAVKNTAVAVYSTGVVSLADSDAQVEVGTVSASATVPAGGFAVAGSAAFFYDDQVVTVEGVAEDYQVDALPDSSPGYFVGGHTLDTGEVTARFTYTRPAFGEGAAIAAYQNGALT